MTDSPSARFARFARFARSRAERARDDSGQALVLAIIVVLLLAVIGPVMVSTLDAAQAVNTNSVELHGAYAAVEAGIQDYRERIDSVPSYTTWTASSPDLTNCAMMPTTGPWTAAETTQCPGTATNPSVPGWEAVFAYPNGSSTGVPTNPAEYYHYAPNNSCIISAGGSGCSSPSTFAKGHILLTVTGRAGSPNHWAYQTAIVAIAKYASYFEDNYYSNYEVLDPNYPQGDPNVTITPAGCSTAPCETVTPESEFTFSYNYRNDAGSVVPVKSVSLLTAACDYYSYQENTFVDALSDTTDNGTPPAGSDFIEFTSADAITDKLSGAPDSTFQTGSPYYGPYLGLPGTSATTLFSQTNLQFTFVTAGGETETASVFEPCATPYDFNTGESFTGPVFSNDELHMCGSPTFSGSPTSLLTSTPADATFKYQWPGSVKVNGVWTVQGYTVDPVNCGGTPTPNLANGIALGVQEILPQFDEALGSYATGACPPTQTGCNVQAYDGCLFTGPTMTELDYNSGGDGKTTLNVWSPLSRWTDGCGTFSPTSAFQTGITMPPNGVIYVQNVPATPTDPNYWCPTTGCPGAAPAGTPTLPSTSSAISPAAVTTGTCFLNPEQSQTATDSPQCTAGDAYVEGELQGELTIGSQDNVYVTRDITYQCADGATGTPASTTIPASCGTAATGTNGPDLLGLYADGDIFLSHPMTIYQHSYPSGCSSIGLSGGTYYFCSPSSVGDSSGYNQCTSNSPTTGTMTFYCEDGSAACSQDGTTAAQTTINYVLPNCDIKNPVLDGAVIALNGSFGIQGWNEGGGSTGASPCVSGAGLDGCMYLNGADVAYYRGPFGITGSTGYYKEFSFDTRLTYLAPPDAITAAVTNWYIAGVSWCGGDNNTASGSATPVCNPTA